MSQPRTRDVSVSDAVERRECYQQHGYHQQLTKLCFIKSRRRSMKEEIVKETTGKATHCIPKYLELPNLGKAIVFAKRDFKYQLQCAYAETLVVFLHIEVLINMKTIIIVQSIVLCTCHYSLHLNLYSNINEIINETARGWDQLISLYG
ncbi:Hypothetical_protein [Hexamita inflata]|uniref:Hypothetical_protein n=1 Tax=Hexamita inflata TaxID=28002 RepID=A0AA86RJV2_9EUKA|nr:Hypothetical protein HINF_LOCUS62573 [Hexamita inflata]CAI9974931.1 Hypothetical protein HINF_LOCUS62576 [Hexamita inflata]CAI9974933.1 Hypothetical protein HINF_LOCUS62578 [Hexamita inflata]